MLQVSIACLAVGSLTPAALRGGSWPPLACPRFLCCSCRCQLWPARGSGPCPGGQGPWVPHKLLEAAASHLQLQECYTGPRLLHQRECASVFGTTVSGHCSMYRYVLFQHVQHLHVSNGSVRACTCQRVSRFLHSIRNFVKAKCAVECNRLSGAMSPTNLAVGTLMIRTSDSQSV